MNITEAAWIAYGWSAEDIAARKRRRLLQVEREACKQDIRTAEQHIATWERRKAKAEDALIVLNAQLGSIP